MAIFQDTDDGAVIAVKALPRSSATGIEDYFGDEAVRIKIKSSPVEGKANKELSQYLAGIFSIPKACVSIKSGETSKLKRICLAGVSAKTAKDVVDFHIGAKRKPAP